MKSPYRNWRYWICSWEGLRGSWEHLSNSPRAFMCERPQIACWWPCSVKLEVKVKTPWSPISAECRIFYHSQLSTQTPGSPRGDWNSGLMISISWIVPRHILDKHAFKIFKEGMQHQIETAWADLKFSDLSLLLEFVQMKLLSFWLLIIFVPVTTLIKHWELYFVLFINLIYSIVSIYQFQKNSYLYKQIFVHILTISLICFTI